MEARLKNDKVAVDLRSQEEVILFEAGERVKVEHNSPITVRIASGERLEGFLLSRDEVELLLTVEEAAEIVDRAPATIYTWLRDGVIEGKKVADVGHGGAWRISLSEIETLEYPKPGPPRKEAT